MERAGLVERGKDPGDRQTALFASGKTVAGLVVETLQTNPGQG